MWRLPVAFVNPWGMSFGMILPVGQPGHDFRFYVILNIIPLLAAYRRSIRKELFQVPWLDVRGNAAIFNSIIVRDDCLTLAIDLTGNDNVNNADSGQSPIAMPL